MAQPIYNGGRFFKGLKYDFYLGKNPNSEAVGPNRLST